MTGWKAGAAVASAIAAGIAAGVLWDLLPGDGDLRLDAPTPAPYSEHLTDAESRYVATLHAKSDHFNTDAQTLIGLGQGVCRTIAQVDVVRSLSSDAVPPADLRVAVDAATLTLCPELRPRVTAYLGRGSAA